MKKKFLFIILSIFLFVGKAYAVPTSQKAELTVLMYHLLSDNTQEWSDFCISPQMFENDIQTLLKKGYTFISPDELSSSVKRGKYALITFDDGYKSNYTKALPILEKYKVPALFFIVTDYINDEGYLSEAEISELSKNPYITIGSHTDKIHNLTPEEVTQLFSSKNSYNNIINDVSASVSKLETLSGKPVKYLSYPYGIYLPTTDFILKQRLKGFITFSSNESNVTLPNGFIAPLGRFNRNLNFQIK